jgi:hypothetical protein
LRIKSGKVKMLAVINQATSLLRKASYVRCFDPARNL